jgi:hypothetical protein
MGDDFQLVTGVPESRAGLAAFYGVATKTINRWKAMGAAAGDPCPFKTPVEMAAWWGRVSKKPVDPRIIAAAEKCSPAKRPAEVPPAKGRIGFRDEPASGNMLERLLSDESRLHQRYRDAIAGDLDDSTIRQYREHWQEAANLLDLHLTRVKKRGELLDPAEVDSAFERIVANLPAALQRSFPKEPPAGDSWLETVTEAIRSAFQRLPVTLEQMLAA